MNQKKMLRIIGLVVGLGIIGLIIFLLIPRSYIKFSVAPGQVSVALNGSTKQSIINQQTIQLSPGHYKVVVSRDEFLPYSKEVDLKNGDTLEFLSALNPQTDAAKQLILDDVSQAILQRFHGAIMTNQTNKITDSYPILAVLPIEARLYTVYSCPSVKYSNDATKIAICVDVYQAGLEPYVTNDIESRGYKISDYEIIYVDKFTNPSTH